MSGVWKAAPTLRGIDPLHTQAAGPGGGGLHALGGAADDDLAGGVVVGDPGAPATWRRRRRPRPGRGWRRGGRPCARGGRRPRPGCSRPARAASRTPSSRDRAPEAMRAVIWPREWPAKATGASSRASRTASHAMSDVSRTASWASRVRARTSASASRRRWARGWPRADSALSTTSQADEARQTSPIPGTWVPWPGKRTAIPTGPTTSRCPERVTIAASGRRAREVTRREDLPGVEAGPQLGHEVGRPVGAAPFEQAPDEGRADDHAVAVGRTPPPPGPGVDTPMPMRTGLSVTALSRLAMSGGRRGQRRPLARDAHDPDAVDPAPGALADGHQAVVGGGGGGQEDRLHAGLARPRRPTRRARRGAGRGRWRRRCPGRPAGGRSGCGRRERPGCSRSSPRSGRRRCRPCPGR